jgi:hypothetical protein
MVPYPNKAQWWVIWLMVAAVWLFGVLPRLGNDGFGERIMFGAVVTGIVLVWRFSGKGPTARAEEGQMAGAATLRSCAACGTRNEEKFQFCGGCGEPLPRLYRKCNREWPRKFKYCGNCGEPL